MKGIEFSVRQPLRLYNDGVLGDLFLHSVVREDQSLIPAFWQACPGRQKAHRKCYKACLTGRGGGSNLTASLR